MEHYKEAYFSLQMAERVNHKGIITRLQKRKLDDQTTENIKHRLNLSNSKRAQRLEDMKDATDGFVDSKQADGDGLSDGVGGDTATGNEERTRSITVSQELPTPDPLQITDEMWMDILDPIKKMDNFWSIWNQIKTKYSHNKLVSRYQFRIKAADSHNIRDIKDWVRLSFDHFDKPSKLTVSVSYILRNRKTGEFRFFYQVCNSRIIHVSYYLVIIM